MSERKTAGAFDIRNVIGALLTLYGVILLLTAAFVWLALDGALPWWLAALVVGRDLAIVAGAVAYHTLIGRFDASPSRLSKLTTVVQIAFVLLELLRLSRWLEVPPPARAGMIAITAAITLASGLHYIVVWTARARRAARARGGHRA